MGTKAVECFIGGEHDIAVELRLRCRKAIEWIAVRQR
jgi:hypothetical protein